MNNSFKSRRSSVHADELAHLMTEKDHQSTDEAQPTPMHVRLKEKKTSIRSKTKDADANAALQRKPTIHQLKIDLQKSLQYGAQGLATGNSPEKMRDRNDQNHLTSLKPRA